MEAWSVWPSTARTPHGARVGATSRRWRQPARAPIWHRAVLDDLDFMHAVLLLLSSVPADIHNQTHQKHSSRASTRPSVAGIRVEDVQANGGLLLPLSLCV